MHRKHIMINDKSKHGCVLVVIKQMPNERKNLKMENEYGAIKANPKDVSVDLCCHQIPKNIPFRWIEDSMTSLQKAMKESMTMPKKLSIDYVY